MFGNLAVIAHSLRPIALRPRLSTGLPFSSLIEKYYHISPANAVEIWKWAK